VGLFGRSLKPEGPFDGFILVFFVQRARRGGRGTVKYNLRIFTGPYWGRGGGAGVCGVNCGNKIVRVGWILGHQASGPWPGLFGAASHPQSKG